MVQFNPKDKGIDYNMALGDVEEFIKQKRERGWNHLNILDALEALGREGKKQINSQLEDMAKRLQKLDCDRSEDDIMIEQLTEGQF